jgi:hypothetical protein
MVAVPARDGPELDWNSTFVLPFPLPLAPAVMANHEAVVVAVQVQPAAAVTATCIAPAGVGTFCETGVIEYAQAPPWLIVNARPAMVTVPARPAAVFGSIASCTDPSPLPVAPDVTRIHGALLVDVHAHPPCDVTATVAVPPPEPTVV